MTNTKTRHLREQRRPAVFTYGFRPFFFGASVWAILSMLVWIAVLFGAIILPIRLDPISWHAHEFLYGYLSAVIGGFVLTAVPNWTGRPPILGWPLVLLFLCWLAGRGAMACSALMPVLLVTVIDLSFLVFLSLLVAREIIASRNWRNLVVLAMIFVFLCGNVLFHLQASIGAYAAQGGGLKLGLGAGIMMIAVIGGRIVPSFTRNWLVKRGASRLPAAPMQGFDKVALLALLVALVLWLVAQNAALTGSALLLAGVLHAVRLSRWQGHQTLAEPLVTVLHVAYAMLPLGALLMGTEIFMLGLFGAAAVQHIWMAGAIGLMTLAVMTRATLGHTDQVLTANAGTVGIYICLVFSVFARLAAGVWPVNSEPLYAISALGWIAAFGGFAILYGPLLLRQHKTK